MLRLCALDDVRELGQGSSAIHGCAITGGRRVYCWGGNDVGQLGNGELGAGEPAPALMSRY